MILSSLIDGWVRLREEKRQARLAERKEYLAKLYRKKYENDVSRRLWRKLECEDIDWNGAPTLHT